MELADKRELYENPMHPYTQALLSAIPVPDIHAKKEEIILQGEVPSPMDPPKGCLFCTRCPHASDRCRREAPELKTVECAGGGTHQAACFLCEGREE